MNAIRVAITAAILLSTAAAPAQWEILPSASTASLRGIHAVGNGVAWASGTEGTVLHTTDDGKTWQRCATPPDATQLDFRGVQAFDARTAIVMSSGKGSLSRLYKTSDACATWKLVFTNPDPDGFWDALVFEADVWHTSSKASNLSGPEKTGFLLGDPVNGRFVIYETRDTGQSWHLVVAPHSRDQEPVSLPKEAAFAASNTSLISPGFHRDFAFVTGGPAGARLILEGESYSPKRALLQFRALPLPLAKSDSAGAFSTAARYTPAPNYNVEFMIVGGDFQHPDDPSGTAVFVSGADRPQPTILPAITPPHGYRSAVAYDAATKTWITVGPNGTDISTDDGRNWRALKPGATDQPDADQHWNALSLPFVIGPHGRIGKLRPDALKAAKP